MAVDPRMTVPRLSAGGFGAFRGSGRAHHPPFIPIHRLNVAEQANFRAM